MKNSIIFDRSAIKCCYPRVDVCARAKQGWKGHTRIKLLSHSCIENNFLTRRVGSLIWGMLFYESVQNLCARSVEIVIFDTSVRSGSFSHGCSLSPERSEGDKNTRTMMNLFGHVYWTLFFLTECVKLALLHTPRVRSSSFTHGVRESILICACATFAHAVCKRATFRMQNKHEKSSFAHSVKKNNVLKTFWSFKSKQNTEKL